MAITGDIRYAIRVLLKARSFTLGVVPVLALGIGANAAVFSALDQTVIRPLPYGARDAEIEVGRSGKDELARRALQFSA
jgi:hypothetical protein